MEKDLREVKGEDLRGEKALGGEGLRRERGERASTRKGGKGSYYEPKLRPEASKAPTARDRCDSLTGARSV